MDYCLVKHKIVGNHWTFNLFVPVHQSDIPDDADLPNVLHNKIQEIRLATIGDDITMFAKPLHGTITALTDTGKDTFGEQYTHCLNTEVQFGFKSDAALASFIFFQNETIRETPFSDFNFGPGIPF